MVSFPPNDNSSGYTPNIVAQKYLFEDNVLGILFKSLISNWENKKGQKLFFEFLYFQGLMNAHLFFVYLLEGI